MYSFVRRNKGKCALLIILIAALLTYRIMPIRTEAVAPQPTPTSYPEQTFAMGLTKTIGEFTYELVEIKDASGGLTLTRSFSTKLPALSYIDIGYPEIKYPDGSVSVGQTNTRTDTATDTWNFPLDTRIPGAEEMIDVNLGGFIVAAPGISGGADIPLGAEYSSMFEGEFKDKEIPYRVNLSLGDSQFHITKLKFHTLRAAGDSSPRIGISVVPVNEAASVSVLGAGTGMPAEATLYDDTGRRFMQVSGSIHFAAEDDHKIEEQYFEFLGPPTDLATSLTFSVRGGGNIVGPFVFENIALVSEDAPPPDPELPDDPDPGDGTPVNVNN